MELIANNFVCFPNDNRAYEDLASLIASLVQVNFSMQRGDRNSNQRTSNFDLRLKEKFLTVGTVERTLNLPEEINNELDFCISVSDKIVAVEVDKANREKILYDLLKAHIYLKSSADFVLLFLPNEYLHSGGVWRLFETGQRRYKLCLEYGLGNDDYFSRILLVGYEQANSDGTPLRRRASH